jgi:exopolysaccharide biosynthesis polyprenyl glycosylphosphotransferase
VASEVSTGHLVVGGAAYAADQPVVLRSPWKRAEASRLQRLAAHFGIRHLLVGVDLTAWCVATALLGDFDNKGFVVLLVAVITLNGGGGLYAPRLTLSVLDQLASLFGRALVAGALVVALKLVAGNVAGEAVVRAAMLYAALAVLGRIIAYPIVRRLRRTLWRSHSVLILGAGRVGGQVAESLLAHPEYGLRPVGFVDDNPLLSVSERPVPLLGGTERLAQILTEGRIRNVVVAFGAIRESNVVDILRTCDRLSCEIFSVPRLYELQALGKDMDRIWSLPVMRMRRAPFRSVTWKFKRVFDVVVAGAALLALAPVMVFCAVAVAVGVGRPVLFRQARVGLDGRQFTLLKFRSLTPVDEEESSSNWNIAQDARMTWMGRLLRRSSLDELPQLWNIVRGDMSLVGPRPERPSFVDQFTNSFPRYMARHRVPAGLTGWAQVHGLRGDTSIEDRARFDNHYIENWSLWQDVTIILRTVAHVAKGS